MKIRGKFALFNALSKLIFVALFLVLMPLVLEKINTINTDNDLIAKRDRILDLIEVMGIDPFISSQEYGFASYNILKEEFINLERLELEEHWNFIEVTSRLVEDEIIDYRILNYSFYVDNEVYLLEIGKSLSSIRQTENNIRWFALVLLLLFIAVTLVLDISYIKLLFQPFDRIIIQKLKKVHDPEHFNFTLINTSTEDFRMLDLTINEMMERIQLLFRKEREFTSNVSHELLTPVSVLQSKLENLLIDSSISEEAMVKISDSLRTLGKFKSIVNSLLLIARIENEQFLKSEQVNIFEIIKEVINELNDQFEASEIELKTNVEEKLNLNFANRALLFTMFMNLYGNALKYTNRGGKITTNTRQTENGFEINIHNTGKEIDKKNLGEIFSRFKKFSSEHVESHGLGLAIAKTIADFHQIYLSAQSEKELGTTFCMVFLKQ